MPKVDSKDWRNLSVNSWNVITFHTYFTDMNRELYGVDYAPMRNYAFEQGALKNAIKAHGPELLRQAFDVCFREYRPTREYPILTAGFAINYRINTVIPRIKAENERRERVERVISEGEHITIEGDAVKAWL